MLDCMFEPIHFSNQFAFAHYIVNIVSFFPSAQSELRKRNRERNRYLPAAYWTRHRQQEMKLSTEKSRMESYLQFPGLASSLSDTGSPSRTGNSRTILAFWSHQIGFLCMYRRFSGSLLYRRWMISRCWKFLWNRCCSKQRSSLTQLTISGYDRSGNTKALRWK